MAHCMEMATHPEAYAIEPHTTKVLAETNPMNNDKLLIHQGTDPPAAKNETMSLPDFREKESPIKIIKRENSIITR
jgi:hypothetical protein